MSFTDTASCFHPAISTDTLAPPKRRFSKAEPAFPSAFSKHFHRFVAQIENSRPWKWLPLETHSERLRLGRITLWFDDFYRNGWLASRPLTRLERNDSIIVWVRHTITDKASCYHHVVISTDTSCYHVVISTDTSSTIHHAIIMLWVRKASDC